MKSTDLGWLAGIIDGEGSISLDKRHKKIYRYPAVSVASTDIEILERCLGITKCGTITNRSPRNTEHKRTWQWRVKGNKVLEVLKLITPMLSCPKKKKRSQFILNQYNKVTTRNGFYTKITLRKRLYFQEQFFKL